MGGGNWTVGTYQSNTQQRAAAGKSTFDYSDQVTTGQTAAVAHELLDPTTVAGPDSPFAGKVMREVAISDEHPNPTAIAVVLDVTASNMTAALASHAKLPQLLGVLQRKGYVDDPQINFCAIGDAYCDRVPLQVGQFESDNRIDAQLEGIVLEGGGGGQMHETYELAAYYLARHTHQEPLELYGQKGYVFFIGDEMPYPVLKRNFKDGYSAYHAAHSIESFTGDQLERDIPTSQIFAELQEKYEVFFLFQRQGQYNADEILPEWRKYLGERALILDDPNAVCEVIAGILAMVGGGLDVDEAIEDLRSIGTDAASLRVAGKALATVKGGSVVKATGSLPDVTDGNAGGTTRL